MEHNTLLFYLGIVLLICAPLFTAWWVLGNRPFKKYAASICFIEVLIGAFFILNERIVEFTIPAIGTIKTAAKRASSDADAISSLKTRVEAQSATIDLIAKDAFDAKQIGKDLSDRNSKAEQKLLQLDKSITIADLTIKKLELYIKFNTTVLSAQNDNRPAYDQLVGWAEDKSHPFNKSSLQAMRTILDQHNPAMVKTGFHVQWDKNIDPHKLSLPELWQVFKNTSQPIVRIGIIEFVCEKRHDVSKRERLLFLINVINNDEDLQVIEYAGRYFAQESGDNLKPLAIWGHQKWWEDNKDSIANN